MREQQKYLDENIQASLDEAINIMEQSLNAVRMKMYGDFGDHSAVSTTALKVKFTKGQLISKGLFGISILPKNQQKISAPVG